MRRFSFSADDKNDNLVNFNDRESHHICKVLRLQTGTEIELFDDSGTVYQAVLNILGDRTQARILSEKKQTDIHQQSLHVYLAIIKPKNIELLLQKCTELGVDSFTPIICERTQGNLARQVNGKGERWRRIIDEACKQCKRHQSMRLHEIAPFEDVLTMQASMENEARFLFWEKEKHTCLQDCFSTLRLATSVRLVFGPEGGFTWAEISRAREAGWQTIGLGNRILRAETAVIAAVSIVQHLLGEM